MSNPNEPRFLPWRLRGSLSIQEQTPNEIIPYETVNDLFPLDPDEKTIIGMNLSLNEFVDLASAIDIGRDIGYPEQSINIWFRFVQAIQEAGSMVTCSDIADCLNDPVVFNVLINNNEFVETLVQNDTFINTLVQNSTVFGDTINVFETTGAERLPEYQEPVESPPEDCDLDKLWAGIREIVERIDRQGRDLLEDLQNINDKVERVQGVIDLVPLVGDTIADIADFFTATIPDILNAYNAYSSPAALDMIACDLFEMVCGECRYPTYEEIFDYFKSFGEPSLPTYATATYAILWNGVKTLSAAPAASWFTINAWQVYTYGFGGKWNGSYGKKTFAIWASFGEDLPNDNWMVLCDACQPVELCWEYDFTQGLHGWTAVTNAQIEGKGLRATNSTGGRFEFLIQEHQYNVTKIEVDWLKEGNFSSFRDIDLFYYNSGVQFGQTLMAPNIGLSSDTIVVNVNAPNTDGLRWFIRDSGAGQTGALYVQRLRLYGTVVTGAPENSTPCI